VPRALAGSGHIDKGEWKLFDPEIGFYENFVQRFSSCLHVEEQI
jgi:hypothetical protein